MTIIDPVAIVLAEYEALKDEQVKRMGTRDGLPYVALGSAVAVAGVTAKFGPLVLLALPIACTVLGWTFLANDHKVSELGRYISDELVPYIQERTPPDTPVFGWESYHRDGPRRRARKAWQMLADLIAFCVTGGAALTAFWAQPDRPAALLAVSAVEAALLLGLAYQIVLHADFASGPGGR